MATAGRGRPLVFLHGAFGYRGWPRFLDLLARRFAIYAPVHPGFDESSETDGLEDVLDLTLYHYDLLDALGLEAPHLVGHFFGAMIAAEVASLYPVRVGKLVLSPPGGLWLDGAPGEDYFAVPLAELRGILFDDPTSGLAMETIPDAGTEEQRLLVTIERARSLSTVGKYLWPIPDKGLKKRMSRIRAPTLVVVASNDRIVPPAYGDAAAALIRGSRLEVIAGAGHLFPLERPEGYASLVADFLAG